MREESGRLKEATPSWPFLIASSTGLRKFSECLFLPLRQSVHTPSMEVQECLVHEIHLDHTHTHTYFSKPFRVTLLKGESQWLSIKFLVVLMTQQACNYWGSLHGVAHLGNYVTYMVTLNSVVTWYWSPTSINYNSLLCFKAWESRPWLLNSWYNKVNYRDTFFSIYLVQFFVTEWLSNKK